MARPERKEEWPSPNKEMTHREVRLHCRLRTPRVPEEEVVAFALDALSRLDLEGEVGIKICSDRAMASFNRKFRGRRGATDVLSFPDGAAGPDGRPYLGDILIAGPVAQRAAGEAGIPVGVEMKRLVLHGILHLAGYDHETDGGAMARKERALRKEWGIP